MNNLLGIERARAIARVTAFAVVVALACVPAAFAHGIASADYQSTITSITPKGLPIDVRVVNRDQLRIENDGSKELIVCGYGAPGDGGCEPYARISAQGVDVNHNTRSYYANLNTTNFGTVPKDIGSGGPKWVRAQNVNFYSYHDHRTHWMGGKVLPPGIDKTNPKRQLVNDWKLHLKYDGKLVTVTGRLDYVGGQTWLQRYGEVLITAAAVLAMLIVFGWDARRRRRARRGADGDGAAADDQTKPPTSGGATVLLPEHEQKEPV